MKVTKKQKKTSNNRSLSYTPGNKNPYYKNFSRNNNQSSYKNKRERKIDFQLIEKNLVEITPNFHMPPQIIDIIKQNKGFYNVEVKAFQFPFINYNNLYNALQNLLTNSEYKDVLEFKLTKIYPIPELTLNALVLSKKLTILKFKISEEKSKKKVYTNFSINYDISENKTINDLSPIFLNNLYEFQKEGVLFGIEKNGRFLLADEMGIGKTVQAIAICTIFKENWPVLIICPSSLKYVWRDEIINWIPDINKDKENVQVFKTGKDLFRAGEKFFIMSYEIAVKLEQEIINKKFEIIVCDEAHYLKSREAKRTKTLIPIIQKSKRVLLLTGTPILAKPVELYSLLNILRPDVFHNFYNYVNRYCNPQFLFGHNDFNGCSNVKELNFLLNNIMIRRLKKDVLTQLPPKKRQKVQINTDQKIMKQIIAIQLSTEEIRNYLNHNPQDPNSLLSEKILDTETSKVFNKAYCLAAEAKIPGVKEYIHYLLENKCKFLIFAHHKIMLDAIENEVKNKKIDYIRIDGNVKIEERSYLVKKFQKEETCLIAILSITACYTGITLTQASTVVFAELHMTPAVMIQAEDRAHRIGQEHECLNIHYLYGKDTIDEILFEMLNKKQNIFTNTLDNLSENMNVKNTYKRIGDFEKGREDLDLNVNTKKVIFTDTGTKNKTLNDFVIFGGKKEDEIDIKDINVHQDQKRNIREHTPTKNNDVEEEKICEEEIEESKDNNNVFDKMMKEKDAYTKGNNCNKKEKNKSGKKEKNEKKDKNKGKIQCRELFEFFKKE